MKNALLCLLTILFLVFTAKAVFAQEEPHLKDIPLYPEEPEEEWQPTPPVHHIPEQQNDPSDSTPKSKQEQPSLAPYSRREGFMAMAGYGFQGLDYGMSGMNLMLRGWHSPFRNPEKGPLLEAFQINASLTIVRGTINFPQVETGMATPSIGCSYLGTVNLGKKHDDFVYIVGGAVSYTIPFGPNDNTKMTPWSFTANAELYFPNAVILGSLPLMPHITMSYTYTPLTKMGVLRGSFDFFTGIAAGDLKAMKIDAAMMWQVSFMILDQSGPMKVSVTGFTTGPLVALPSLLGEFGKAPMTMISASLGWAWDNANHQDGFQWMITLGVMF